MAMRPLAAVFGLAFLAAAETAIPPIWPQLQGIFPNGARRGTEVKVIFNGRNLQDSNAVVFRSGKLKGRVTKAAAYQVEALISVASDAEPGRHDLRLIAPHGSAIGYFDVGVLREQTEKEPNETAAQAEPLTFPVVINGIIKQADYDYFRFDAKSGQTLVFDVLATRNGANTDAVISILDEAGEELAYSDDYYGFKDPHVVHEFAKDGTYFVRVYGSSEAGSNTSTYRLIAGAMPHVDYAMPAGGKAGSTVELTFHGVNLAGLREVTLGDTLAKAEVTQAGATQARVRLTVPVGTPPGDYRMHAAGSALPVPFVVSSYNEIDVADGRARRRSDPIPVSLPVVINGVIDKPRAADYFIFRVDQPKTVVLDANSMQLGFLTDPLVAIYDESGKRLAYQDDPTTNTGKEPANMDPHLVYKIEKPGRYIAMVRDAQFRGDRSFVYRVTFKDAEPDFSVKTIGTDDTFYRGRTNSLLVRVRRLEGWNAPVKVWADNLPPGVKVEAVTAEPKNTPYTGTCGETHYLDGANVELRFTVDTNAPLTHAPIVIQAKGVLDGRTVTHTAKARYFRRRIRHIGDAEEDRLRITISDAPGVVLDVPQTLTLAKDGSAALTAIVTRLDSASDPLEISLETSGDGLSMETASIPATATRADIRLRAADKATGEFRLVGRVGGVVVGRSHPVQVRIPKS
jgi:hypothetical protein